MMEEQEKKVDRIVTFGIGLLVAAAVTSPFYLPQISPDQKPVQPAAQQLAIPVRQRPQTQYSSVPSARDMRMNIFQENPPKVPERAWVGLKLTIDDTIRAHWATMRPVTLIIPELSYVDRFPVETGMNVLETTLYAPLQGRTYHFLIAGKDPNTGHARELLNQVINPEGK